MVEPKQERNSSNPIIAILLTIIAIGVVFFVGYTIYTNNQRSECVKRLQDKYVDNLWLQNKIQAECGTK